MSRHFNSSVIPVTAALIGLVAIGHTVTHREIDTDDLDTAVNVISTSAVEPSVNIGDISISDVQTALLLEGFNQAPP
jgi:hypothetical protein